MIIGATIGAYVGVGASIISQGIFNGWSNINSWQVLLDGTILGYIGAATASGSGYYLISEKLWNSMSVAERWYNNSTYIRDANKLGSQFSIFAERIPKVGSSLWQEIQYLIENNIPWSMFYVII